MYKILNLNKSSPDNRDIIYENITEIGKMPISCDYRNDLLPVRDQESQGTCYAQSVACMKEWQEKKDVGLNEYLSPQFFYNNRNYWNNNIQDGDDILEDYGMTGRDVMKILKNVGICLEREYPYGTEKSKKLTDIDIKIIESAKKHTIKSYARINTAFGLKKSLLNNGPCLITFPVYNYGSQMWIRKNNESDLGGHAMTVVGYTEESFIIRNSWGPNWQDNGYCYYLFKDWGCHWECWTTVDLETKQNDFNSDSNKNNFYENSQSILIPAGKYNLTCDNNLIDNTIMKCKNNTIFINNKGTYSWNGTRYKSIDNSNDYLIIYNSWDEVIFYVLEDSNKNIINAKKIGSCLSIFY